MGGEPCGWDRCWCAKGMRPQDMPNPAIGDPGRFHLLAKVQAPPPLEIPIAAIGLSAILLLVLSRL